MLSGFGATKCAAITACPFLQRVIAFFKRFAYNKAI